MGGMAVGGVCVGVCAGGGVYMYDANVFLSGVSIATGNG